MEASHDYGFRDGIAFPITTGFGPLGCVSLGADEVPYDLQVLAMGFVRLTTCFST